MTNTTNHRRRRTHSAFPSFASMINDIMNSPIHDIINEKKIHSQPAVNVRQDEKEFTIEMAIPGYNKEDISIEIKEHKLKISSSADQSSEDTYRLREFGYGKFSRTFTLPKNADQENIKASIVNGVLTLSIGKIAEPTPKQITIK